MFIVIVSIQVVTSCINKCYIHKYLQTDCDEPQQLLLYSTIRSLSSTTKLRQYFCKDTSDSKKQICILDISVHLEFAECSKQLLPHCLSKGPIWISRVQTSYLNTLKHNDNAYEMEINKSNKENK